MLLLASCINKIPTNDMGRLPHNNIMYGLSTVSDFQNFGSAEIRSSGVQSERNELAEISSFFLEDHETQ